MKQITLIRHAKVDIDNSQKIDSLSLQKWIEAYDTAPIVTKSLPPKETVVLAQSADVAVTSTLSRASDSAKVLDIEVHEQNQLFNEAAIPEVNIPFFKLKPKHWLVILRVLLLFGLGKRDVSLKTSKAQAKEAAQRLLELSTEHDHVLLVGHGGMNWLIRQVLLKEGWELDGKGSHGNWGTTVLKSMTICTPRAFPRDAHSTYF